MAAYLLRFRHGAGENYDVGGPGIAYNVNSSNGTGNSYRSDGVDLETTATQEALRSRLDQRWAMVPSYRERCLGGVYTVSLRVAAPSAVTSASTCRTLGRQPERTDQHTGDGRLAELDYGNGEHHVCGRAADVDFQAGRRRLEPQLHDVGAAVNSRYVSACVRYCMRDFHRRVRQAVSFNTSTGTIDVDYAGYLSKHISSITNDHHPVWVRRWVTGEWAPWYGAPTV